jgi:putative sporulation protein YtaF
MILGLMGLWIILQAILDKGGEGHEKEILKEERTLFRFAVKSLGITIQVIRNPAEGDLDQSGVIDKREALLLGLALSVDAIGAGIGSALAGLGSLWISVATGIFQMLLLSAGGHFGKKLGNSGKLNKRLLSFAPGILLITMALIRIG